MNLEGEIAKCKLSPNYQMKISKNYQLEMFDSDEGGGVNYQMQIVTKLPNENIQNYQLEMFNSGGSVNYQMQIVTNYQMKISKTTN